MVATAYASALLGYTIHSRFHTGYEPSEARENTLVLQRYRLPTCYHVFPSSMAA